MLARAVVAVVMCGVLLLWAKWVDFVFHWVFSWDVSPFFAGSVIALLIVVVPVALCWVLLGDKV